MDDNSTNIYKMRREFPVLTAKQETDQFLDNVETMIEDLSIGIELAELSYETLSKDIASFALKQSIIEQR